MNEYLPVLTSFRELLQDEKMRLPVSINAQPNGTAIIVSRFEDQIWEFWPYIQQENKSAKEKHIDWRFKLPRGRLFTDPEYAELLDASKEFVLTLLLDPIESRKRPGFSTLIQKFYALRLLLQWMDGQHIRSFTRLSEHAINYVPVVKQKTQGTGEVSADTASARLRIVEELFLQREKYSNSLNAHPWPLESASWLAGTKVGLSGGKAKTEIIPDMVAVNLINVAHAIVVRDEEWLAQASLSDRVRFRTACYIVIDMFSGIRNSEVLSLSAGCLSRRMGRDNSAEILLLHGSIYKTGQRAKAWQVPPIVEDAIRALERLSALSRTLLEQEEVELESRLKKSIAKERLRIANRLATVRSQKDKLFLGFRANHIAVVCGSALNLDLRAFCEDFGINDAADRPYRLHSHQFRRTYAYFMARSQLGDLLTLRDHFGHSSLDMTTYYADGAADQFESDIELIDMVADEKQTRQIEIMGGYLDSDMPLANGMHWLKEWRSTVRTAENKEALIAQYSGAITLNGTGHSWCVGSAKGTSCGGLCVFEAQKCVDCNYGIIGQEHRPVWEGIRDQQKEAIALNDMGVSGVARAQNLLGYAEKVLMRLDGSEI